MHFEMDTIRRMSLVEFRETFSKKNGRKQTMDYLEDNHLEEVKEIYVSLSNGDWKTLCDRSVSMQQIHFMKKDEFLDCLYNNKLPYFARACYFDSDYRDEYINSKDAYNCRHLLRYMSREDYLIECMSDKKYTDYLGRELAIFNICSMSREDFLKQLNDNSLPECVRAEEGDPDYQVLYTSYSCDSAQDWLDMHRIRLKTKSYQEFIEMSWV